MNIDEKLFTQTIIELLKRWIRVSCYNNRV